MLPELNAKDQETNAKKESRRAEPNDLRGHPSSDGVAKHDPEESRRSDAGRRSDPCGDRFAAGR